MQRKSVLTVVLAMAATLLFAGVSLAGFCTDNALPNGCIQHDDLHNRSVRAPAIAPGVVNTLKIKDGTIQTIDLADDAVTSAKVLNNSLTANDLGANSVGASEITEDAVASSELVEDVTFGDSANGGSIVVQGTGRGDALYVTTGSTSGAVYIGQGGLAANRMDANLYVRDAFESSTQYTLSFDSSAAYLHLGHGSTSAYGEPAEIQLDDGRGRAGVFMTGGDADLWLGAGTGDYPSDDGDLIIKNSVGTVTVEMNGQTGTVQNNLLNGNGLVKAWAKINSNGSVADCWRCNTNPIFTYRVSTGSYSVDFTPLASDIRNRPKSIVVSNSAVAHASYTNSPDFSQIWVYVRHYGGNLIDRGFDVIIY